MKDRGAMVTRLARVALVAWVCLAAGAAVGLGQMMPPGHPKMEAAAGEAAPAPALGKITLVVHQGTKDGPSAAGDAVAIELLHANMSIRKLTATLDVNGVAILDKIPLSVAVVPVVTIQHAGLVQQTEGAEMGPANPQQEINAKVFETTNDATLIVQMRHVILEASETGPRVTEMLALQNPTDRIYVGRKEDAGTVTFGVHLPADADQITLGDAFPEDSTKTEHGHLTTGVPLFPGPTQFHYTYNVPVREGKINFEITAPAITQQLRVFVPADGSTVATDGLQGPTVPKEQPNVRQFSANNMKPGQVATLMIGGWVDRPAAVAPAAGGGWPQTLTIIGIVVAVILGVGMMFMKRPKAAGGKR